MVFMLMIPLQLKSDCRSWIKDDKVVEDDQFPALTRTRSCTLCIPSFTPECEGKYWCKVTNEDGVLMSHRAELKGTGLV